MNTVHLYTVSNCRGDIAHETATVPFADIVEIHQKYGEQLAKFKTEDIDDIVCEIEEKYKSGSEVLDLALSYCTGTSNNLGQVINNLTHGTFGGMENEESCTGYGRTLKDAMIGYATVNCNIDVEDEESDWE